MSERVRCTCGAEHDCTSATPRLATLGALEARSVRELRWELMRAEKAERDKANKKSEAYRARHRRSCTGVVYLMKMSGMSSAAIGKALGIPASRIGHIYENALLRIESEMDRMVGSIPEVSDAECIGEVHHLTGVPCVFCYRPMTSSRYGEWG